MTSTSTSTSTASASNFLAAQRQQLLARRESYLADVARSTATALELTEDGANQDMADEDGFGEGDTLNVERDRLLVVASEAKERVAEIDAALARVEAGTYGVCEACDKPIAKARLEVVPEATLCVNCKTGAFLRRK